MYLTPITLSFFFLGEGRGIYLLCGRYLFELQILHSIPADMILLLNPVFPFYCYILLLESLSLFSYYQA